MELRKINVRDAAAQWEYTTALPADENGLTNPYHGVSFDEDAEKVLPTLISYEHPVNMPDWFVPETYYYLWDDNRLIGEFRIRHHLTEALRNGITSTFAGETVCDVNWLTGATKFIMFGSCGSLDKEKTFGKYIIPTERYRGEGCSYYYAEPADYISIRNTEKTSAIFDEIGAPHVNGRVWTTGSMLRETVGLVRRRKEEGCLAVEMELAGVEAVCVFNGFELYIFLEAGDVLGENSWKIEGLLAANHDLGKLMIALEIAKRVGG